MPRIIHPFIACLSLLFVTQFALGASVAEEKERLAALQQGLKEQQASLEEMQAELETYPAKVSTAQSQLAKAEQELAAGEQEVAELESKADSSLEVKRELTLKEHAVRMSERRVRSENRMLERYERYRDNLQADIDEANTDITQLQQQIAQQRQRIASAESAAQKPANPAPTASQPSPELPGPPPTAAADIAQDTEAEAPEEAAKPAEPPALSKQDYEAVQTATQAMDRAEKLIAGKPNGAPRYSELQLTGSAIKPVAFTHLGADQYRTELVLPSGRQRFRIDSLRFRTTIAPDNGGETYVFMVDASDRDRLKASYFKKSLLAYVGEDAVLASASSEMPEADQHEELQLVTLASGESVELSEDEVYALEIASEHAALLDELQLEEDPGTPFFSRLSLSGNMVVTKDFEYLGQGQYRAEATVQGGRQSVKIHRSSFRIDIPSADDGESYLFFIDASHSNRLLLTYYKKSIQDYL